MVMRPLLRPSIPTQPALVCTQRSVHSLTPTHTNNNNTANPISTCSSRNAAEESALLFFHAHAHTGLSWFGLLHLRFSQNKVYMSYVIPNGVCITYVCLFFNHFVALAIDVYLFRYVQGPPSRYSDTRSLLLRFAQANPFLLIIDMYRRRQ